MTISKNIEQIIAGSSFIRKMFEEGARLKQEHGAENVYDFSLGNPNVPPPEKFNEILRETVSTCGLNDHCYMPNTGRWCAVRWRIICPGNSRHRSPLKRS
jgi:aspartate aminotransferase